LLHQRLRECCYVRRNKSVVLAHILDSKILHTIPLPLTNRSTYDAVHEVMEEWKSGRVDKARAYQALVQITGDEGWLQRGRIFVPTHMIKLEDQSMVNVMLLDDEWGYTYEDLSESREPSFQLVGGRWLLHGKRGYYDIESGIELPTRAVGGDSPHLNSIEILKQISVEGKMVAVEAWIQNFLDTTERKLIVFGIHRNVVEHLAARFDAPYIHGGLDGEARQAAVNAFQYDPDVRVIVLNIQAGGVGLTLTAASDVAFVELGWTPGEHQQAEDRAHRIGQTRQVNIWYLIADQTIEVEVAELIEQKRVIVDAVNAGIEVTDDLKIAVAQLERALLGGERIDNPMDQRLEVLGHAVVEQIKAWEGFVVM